MKSEKRNCCFVLFEKEYEEKKDLIELFFDGLDEMEDYKIKIIKLKKGMSMAEENQIINDFDEDDIVAIISASPWMVTQLIQSVLVNTIGKNIVSTRNRKIYHNDLQSDLTKVKAENLYVLTYLNNSARSPIFTYPINVNLF